MMSEKIGTVVVGHGLAGRSIHCPLIRRQPGLELMGVVARDSSVRAEAVATWGVRGYGCLDEALSERAVRLIVIATPHDSHADLVVRTLDAGKDCVVDKVMALVSSDADRMIEARDRSGRMLSVFHNRRWDWDYLTLKRVLGERVIGEPFHFESSVCRYAAPRSWRRTESQAGTILHDWGSHLVDQALQLGLGQCRRLSAWIRPAPWEGVETGGHGQILLEFDRARFQVETSRICVLDRPRWWVLGSEGGLTKFGIDPQEDALRAGDLDGAAEPPGHRMVRRQLTKEGKHLETFVARSTEGWDCYYSNIVDHIARKVPLSVTAEQGREVVRVLEAACLGVRRNQVIEGPWGF
ncbi:MAG: oxidoreductase [Isosphaeraceae bacterium]